MGKTGPKRGGRRGRRGNSTVTSGMQRSDESSDNNEEERQPRGSSTNERRMTRSGANFGREPSVQIEEEEADGNMQIQHTSPAVRQRIQVLRNRAAGTESITRSIQATAGDMTVTIPTTERDEPMDVDISTGPAVMDEGGDDFRTRQLKTRRDVFKRSFYCTIADINQLTDAARLDKPAILAKFSRLEDVHLQLKAMNQRVFDALVGRDAPTPCLDQELRSSLDTGESVKKIQEDLRELGVVGSVSGNQDTGTEPGKNKTQEELPMELPKMEVIKYDGQSAGWLSWWGQFRAIHENQRVPALSKFRYLLQSVASGSKAEMVVKSMDVTAENYPLVIQRLKDRFGDEDEIRDGLVNEIIDLVQSAVVEKLPFVSLYDKLECKLAALGTLGESTKQHCQLLVARIEVALPLEMARNWELRKEQVRKEASGSPFNLLDSLMAFLQKEVKLHEKITRARTLVDNSASTTFKPKYPTVANLSAAASGKNQGEKRKLSEHNINQGDSKRKPPVCNFCEGQHPTNACLKVNNWQRKQKMDHLRKVGSCFRCLKKGHQARECRSKIRCCNCKGNHYPIICGGRSVQVEDKFIGSNSERQVSFQPDNGQQKQWKPRPWTRTISNDQQKEEASGSSQGPKFNRTINNFMGQLSGTNSGSEEEASLEQPARQRSNNQQRRKTSFLVSNAARSARILKETPLQTIKVLVSGPGGEKLCRALLDSGASKSAILKKTAEELQLEKIHTESIGHNLYGGSETREVDHSFYRIQLTSICGRYQISMPVMDEKRIVNRVSTGASEALLRSLKKAGIELTDCNDDGEIELLLGNDVYGKLMTGNLRKIPYKSIEACGPSSEVNEIVVEGMESSSEITALETLFGWVLSGYSEDLETGGPDCMTSLLSVPAVSQLWDLEVLGIRDPIEAKSKKEIDEDIAAYFQDTAVQGEDGRFSIKLPFLMDRSSLPNNFGQAYRRLESTCKKLEDIGYLDQYEEVFEDWLQEGIIEEVPLTEMKTGPFSYLPHRPVIKTDSSTTKIRPVFDASCKLTGGYSLNDILAKGPNLLEKIPDILTRFRLGQVAAISDIRKAFLQIEVDQDDRDVLRFLWKDKAGNLKVFRHRRVVFGVNCSPFLLAAVLEKHLKSFGTITSAGQQSAAVGARVATKLLNSFYVDNSVASFESAGEYEEFRETAVQLLSQAQFDLRMWESNLEVDDAETTKVLGLTWNKAEDTLRPVVEKVQIPEVLTKRTLLAAAHSLFDPIGIYTPVTLVPKLLLRQEGVKELGWDDELSEDIRKKFSRWCEEILVLDQLNVKRPLAEVNPSKGKWSLHVFCDASKDAYGAVAFVRVETPEGVTVRFVQARNRLAPANATIPRLELLACLIGVRLAKSILGAVGIEWPLYLWSDSATALAWIRRPIVWGVFVENRVKEIRNTFEVSCWKFVPGLKNPADIPSRGLYPLKFADSAWLEGPAWLHESEDQWPSESGTIDEVALKAEKRKSTIQVSAVIDQERKWYCRTSGYRRNVRIVAYLLRWLRKKEGEVNWSSAVLEPEEVQFAERVVWAAIQEESCLGEKVDGAVQKRQSGSAKKVGLGQKLTKRQGLWCVNTRLTMKNDLEGFLWPVYLPHGNEMVRLLIEAVHLECHHAGVSVVLSKLREQVWIQNGRQTVKKVISRCVRCRRDKGKKLSAPTAPLPKDRMEASKVFEVTGVDYGGPLYLSNGEKVWFALFTCAVYRAIHLELVPSLSTESFIQVFRRFRNRRGHVAKVYSDNGTNFRGYKNLMDQIDWNEVKQVSGLDKVKWQLNPPAAPWWGGFWERLIQMVKQILRRTYGSASLDREEMETALTDAEAVLNSRPLTAVNDDAGDLQPLTPNSFLLDAATVESLDLSLVEKLGYPDLYRKREALRVELKERFRAEYLGNLAAMVQQRKSKELKVGELVLVEAENQKRVLWPIAKVVEMIPGRDGVCRLARLKTAKGELLRPVQRLVPLGVESVPAEMEDVPMEGPEVIEEQPQPMGIEEQPRPLEPETTTRSGRVSRRPDRLNYTVVKLV